MSTIDTDKLKELRKKKGIRQEQICSLLDISQSTYSAKEKTGDFTENEIERIAALLKVESEMLYNNKAKDGKVDDALQLLAEKAIRTEALLTAVLIGLTKVLESQTGETASKILEDLTRVANQQSSNFDSGLK